eukprot:1876078-Pleurochrysis_carterae.AAC.2
MSGDGPHQTQKRPKTQCQWGGGHISVSKKAKKTSNAQFSFSCVTSKLESFQVAALGGGYRPTFSKFAEGTTGRPARNWHNARTTPKDTVGFGPEDTRVRALSIARLCGRVKPRPFVRAAGGALDGACAHAVARARVLTPNAQERLLLCVSVRAFTCPRTAQPS